MRGLSGLAILVFKTLKMKKILYTLFAFAIIVACEKDMDENYDASSINPIEAEVTVDSSSKLDAALDFINSLNDGVSNGEIEVSPKSSKGSSTAKAGDYGTNYIQIMFFDYTLLPALGERDYAYARSDNHDLLCADVTEDPATAYPDAMSGITEVSYSLIPHPTLASRGFSQLITEVIDATGTSSSTTNVQTSGWNATFNADFDRIFPALADRSGITGGLGVPTNRFNTTCDPAVDYSTYYTVTAAPFPLTGFLATLNSNAPAFTGSAANYAGTTRESVETACTTPLADVSAYYTITEAPFPLTGFLATIVDAQRSNITGSSANYAGTTRDAVITEIERDIRDGR